MEGVFVVRVDIVYPFRTKRGVLRRWVYQGGLVLLMWSRVGYWVFGCFPCQRTLLLSLIPEYSKFHIPLRGPEHFISKKYDSSFVTIWNLSFFSDRANFSLFIHISAVNWGCWFPYALSTICWNFANQYLIYCTPLFPLIITRPSSW